MKKWWSVLCVTGFMLIGMGLVHAQPEPIRQVEMNRKPGVDFLLFKSVGNEVSVDLEPSSSWAIEKTDPFLEKRIKDLTLKVAKTQEWVTTANVDADLKLSVKITEWGRLKGPTDNNLMEYLTFEVKARTNTADGVVFRGKGKYTLVNPGDPNLKNLGDAYSSIMEEFLAALHTN